MATPAEEKKEVCWAEILVLSSLVISQHLDSESQK